MNETDIHKGTYPTQYEEHPGLDQYPSRDVPKLYCTGITANQVCKKKIISPIDEKLNKVEQ